ncbi:MULTISPECIES: SDR family oxidoreductase [Burkholderia]|uniref:SDR family oxidoreductase n=1 Tax=Burkholderia TaxID=32008 RepID=UPI0005A06AB7|nr:MULTISPECIES: SDR family oxidoreductase [Burkholderia]MCA8265292.1 SDR family oxidoreductase [Burkholderia vietnamiensis]UKV72262.1 SDR family oxidoreductase [Burkholderia vietnamiensis]HDR8928173.1 SDR family oxidoreductase [Burkholderia vietnamiensis]HDR9023756.1 SDR family oxidoreductase [Burkholderia vietnamiensis]HDR9213092.1 SDR family oxidoreductase [Burkholderia vietnamiensis]
MNATACAPRVRAIVTGHTRGLGAWLAEQLLQQDIAVLGVSRSRHPSLAATAGDRLVETELDLSDTAAVAAWLAGGALRSFVDGASLVLLFNNAGVVDPIGPLAAQDPALVARAVALNVAAPLMLSAALVQAAAAPTECRVLHVSSGAARNAYAGWSVYCATKAALDHHARAVALDANRALRICSVAPGVVDTGMQATIRSTSEANFPMREKFDALKASGALSTPDEAARHLIGYALSDAFGAEPTADVRNLPAG